MPLAPAVFMSHGSPLFALQPGQAGAALSSWAQCLDGAGATPAAVVLMSPHWATPTLQIMAAAQPATWHDFGGFAPELYKLQYPAAGHPALAANIQAVLRNAGMAADLDSQRPFDHGAWVPMMHLWPKANVPLVQLSLPASATPQRLLQVGAALAQLRQQGVMLVGSGSMTHNLGDVSRAAAARPAPELPYVRPFADWMLDTLRANDLDGLCDFERLAPHAAQAHPTTEHLLPLFFALGAVSPQDSMQVLTQEVQYAGLAMDTVVWG